MINEQDSYLVIAMSALPMDMNHVVLYDRKNIIHVESNL
jgi:hypothetical protein